MRAAGWAQRRSEPQALRPSRCKDTFLWRVDDCLHTRLQHADLDRQISQSLEAGVVGLSTIRHGSETIRNCLPGYKLSRTLSARLHASTQLPASGPRSGTPAIPAAGPPLSKRRRARYSRWCDASTSPRAAAQSRVPRCE